MSRLEASREDVFAVSRPVQSARMRAPTRVRPLTFWRRMPVRALTIDRSEKVAFEAPSTETAVDTLSNRTSARSRAVGRTKEAAVEVLRVTVVLTMRACAQRTHERAVGDSLRRAPATRRRPSG